MTYQTQIGWLLIWRKKYAEFGRRVWKVERLLRNTILISKISPQSVLRDMATWSRHLTCLTVALHILSPLLDVFLLDIRRWQIQRWIQLHDDPPVLVEAQTES